MNNYLSRTSRSFVLFIVLGTLMLSGCPAEVQTYADLPETLEHVRSAIVATWPATVKERMVLSGGFVYNSPEDNIDINVTGFGLAVDVEDGIIDLNSNESVIRFDGLVQIEDWFAEGPGNNYVIGATAVAYETVGPVHIVVNFGPLDEKSTKGTLVTEVIQCIGQEGDVYMECYLINGEGNPLAGSPWLNMFTENSDPIEIIK